MKTIKNVYINRLQMEELPTNELSTDDITVTSAFFGRNPLSSQYGRIIGFFDKDNTTYRFIYQVHRPKQHYAQSSNEMIDLEKVVIDNSLFKTTEDTDFGLRAFWVNTPKSYLKEISDTDAYMLRELMEKITEYSQKYDLCEQLKKTDIEAINRNPMFANTICDC